VATPDEVEVQSVTDLQGLSDRIGAVLGARGEMLATAESCTGGWIAQTVTAKAGSSGWFDRGYVTYSDDAKRDMLGVSAETLNAHGAVSEPVVREMAAGALKGAATVAVAVSGIAGPGGATDGKPVGQVCIGWAHRDGTIRSESHHYEGDRAAVREQAVADALAGVIDLVTACRRDGGA
jgi:nicotinamide-nucleotide amidase